ncbi:hypothetical protein MDAP_001906 [Mitosporidium daphniae]|uniref:FAR1 domain-containing protein n=1 Tax=Mitosporidium daphniae TaxID=1485682 RepID=A0A098VYV0_9MICR|nr:uncharacterized protein DI09_129p40 [Mitosporidium daphniae]KGG52881.1 hypothetical protein DI09_129p40 [Mitosporidium daphniae]|eukprot:XP_013239317.1 uncharacterized protein DI09_129p40 [Mitosporidium daphniae]
MSQIIYSAHPDTMQESQEKDAFKNAATSINIMPVLDQAFSSFQDVEVFLDCFSRFNNFSVVLLRSQKIFDIVMQATFGCYRSGKYRCRSSSSQNLSVSQLNMHSQKSVKTDCPWRVNVRYSTRTCRFVITKVILEHNHSLSPLLSSSNRILLNRDEMNSNSIQITDRLKEFISNNALPTENSPQTRSLIADSISFSMNTANNIKRSRRSRNKPFQASYGSSSVVLSQRSCLHQLNHIENDAPSPKKLAENNDRHVYFNCTHSVGDSQLPIDDYSYPTFNFSFEDHSDLDNLSQAISYDLSSVLRLSMPSFKETDP